MTPRGAVGANHSGPWRPPIDVYETEDTVSIVAEVAGMDREAIEVEIDRDIVSIRGVRPDPNVCDNRAFHEAHIAYGEFAADVYVPHNVDTDRATATYENGFLMIQLPRVQGRTIVPTAPAAEPSGDRRSDA
jgi:HSP20 family protein